MKTFEQIKDECNICNYGEVEICGIKMLAGEIYDRTQKIYFSLGDNEDGWEHVAIHVGNGKKTPSWEVMCKAKAVFWGDEEEVVQIHPKKSAYFHGIEGANMEVLHLWRPKNGDWTLMDKR